MTEITPEAQSQPTQAKTSITMVLDHSGSMEACRAATIESVNAYLQKGRIDDNLKDADFELAIFDTEAYEVIRRSVLSAANDITRDEFEPRGGTPLLDAVGRGIDGLDKRSRDDKAILVIVTDGEENSSRKHTYESIQALLEDRQKKGWMVLFLGAGLDSAQQGLRMGVPGVNVANIGLKHAQLRACMDTMAETNATYASAPTPGARRNYAASAKLSRSARVAMGDASGGDGIVDNGSKTGGIGKLFRRGKKTPAATAAPPPPPAGESDAWIEPRGDAWN
ncbi:MAG: VWA domain-containing protein [Hyphomicrobium sp.]|uniref:vWA domain-containing protein n=1 Tax=Hyphomicrobium sp. TaxID=82 RepID=UPI0039E234A3